METDKERKTMEAKKRTGLVLEGGKENIVK